MEQSIFEHDFLVMDFEFTTHKSWVGKPRAFFPEIIEVGAVLTAAPEFSLERTYQSFVKPRFFPRLTQECKDIAMIQQTDVDGGIDLEEMIASLHRMYKPGKTFFVAWGEADRQVLQEECRRYKIDYPFVVEDYLDLAVAYRDFYQLPRRRSLKDAITEQNIESHGFWHMAINDAANTAKLLQHLLQAGWRWEEREKA